MQTLICIQEYVALILPFKYIKSYFLATDTILPLPRVRDFSQLPVPRAQVTPASQEGQKPVRLYPPPHQRKHPRM